MTNQDNTPTIIISRAEYNRLLQRDLMLLALEHSGVDNWDGYGDAQDLMDEWEGED